MCLSSFVKFLTDTLGKNSQILLFFDRAVYEKNASCKNLVSVGTSDNKPQTNETERQQTAASAADLLAVWLQFSVSVVEASKEEAHSSRRRTFQLPGSLLNETTQTYTPIITTAHPPQRRILLICFKMWSSQRNVTQRSERSLQPWMFSCKQRNVRGMFVFLQ